MPWQSLGLGRLHTAEKCTVFVRQETLTISAIVNPQLHCACLDRVRLSSPFYLQVNNIVTLPTDSALQRWGRKCTNTEALPVIFWLRYLSKV